MGKHWLPLESNPDVFGNFAAKLGLRTDQGVEFCDVYGLDEELLAMVPQPVLAVLMLFPITKESEAAKNAEEQRLSQEGQPVSGALWYSKQTVGNACGTVALLHAVANNAGMLALGSPPSPGSHHPPRQPPAQKQAHAHAHTHANHTHTRARTCAPADGSFLERFLADTAGMTPEQRAAYLEAPPEGAPDIDDAHEAAAREGDTAAPAPEEDVDLHFLALVHVDGCLYELDGRKKRPINHGKTTQQDLLRDAAAVVRKFVEATNSLQFSLMAMCAAGNTS